MIISMLGITYLMSPVSYFFVSYHQPHTPHEYVDFLKDNGIDPQYHKVYVLRSVLTSFEHIGQIDGMDMSGKMIEYTVFNTKPYAIKALFDKRVESSKRRRKGLAITLTGGPGKCPSGPEKPGRSETHTG
ncbi:MAG: hypothetical protein ACOY31_11235 [Bacillota bacterium]